MSNDALEYENIKEFVNNKLNTEYQILQYIVFDSQNQDSFNKLETLTTKIISSNELKIKIKLFNGYYFKNSFDNEKEFS